MDTNRAVAAVNGAGNYALAVMASTVSMSPSSLSPVLGGQVGSTPTVRDAAGSILSARKIVFSSDNPGVASVDPVSGLVSTHARATTYIRAQSGTAVGTATIVVHIYVYDYQIVANVFDPHADLDDGTDEYRMDIWFYFNGGNTNFWEVNVNGNGSDSFGIGLVSSVFSGYSPGISITISANGYEEDDPGWFDPHDQMGSSSVSLAPGDQGVSYYRQPYSLGNGNYTFHGYVVVWRRAIP